MLKLPTKDAIRRYYRAYRSLFEKFKVMIEEIETEQHEARERTLVDKYRHETVKEMAVRAEDRCEWEPIEPEFNWYPCSHTDCYHAGGHKLASYKGMKLKGKRFYCCEVCLENSTPGDPYSIFSVIEEGDVADWL